MTTTRKVFGPASDTEWRTSLAITYGDIDQEVADELDRHPLPAGHYPSELAKQVALARVAERRVAELVGFARSGRNSWEWIATQLGVSRQAAHQRYGKLPPAPFSGDHEHADGCQPGGLHLRHDLSAWGCRCGAAGTL